MEGEALVGPQERLEPLTGVAIPRRADIVDRNGKGTRMDAADRRATALELIDRLPGHEGRGGHDHVVPVWVRRSELASMMGYHDGVGGPPADKAYAAALHGAVPAIRQHVLDGAFKRTGEVAAGEAGAHKLAAHWGTAPVRKLTFSRDALADASAASPEGMAALATIVQASVRRTPFLDRGGRKAAAETGPER